MDIFLFFLCPLELSLHQCISYFLYFPTPLLAAYTPIERLSWIKDWKYIFSHNNKRLLSIVYTD